MTTTQVAPNGHHVPPPPCDDATSIVIPSEHRERGIPQPVDNNPQPEPILALKSQISDVPSSDRAPAPSASAYHVPPKRFAPRPKAYAYDDSFHRSPETEPLPDRCQFMFSDGRQCSMARSDIHPSLCVYHSDREEQLFGDPTYRRETRALDFPELFSACRDLTSPAGVNRALGQVFRLLAQRRISRQEAATFAKLAHLLLQSIRAAHAESTLQPEPSSRAANWSEGSLCHQPTLEEASMDSTTAPLCSGPPAPTFDAHSFPVNLHSSAPALPPNPAATPAPASSRSATNNPSETNRSAAFMYNSGEISTYENAGFEAIQNQHLQKSRAGVCSSGRTADSSVRRET